MEAAAISLGQFLGVVAGGGKDDPLLSGDVLSPSLPPQLFCVGLDEGDDVAVPLVAGGGRVEF